MTAPPTITHALRGLLVWVLTSLIAVFGLVSIWYLLPVIGIDPNNGVNPRTEPFAAGAMTVVTLAVVLAVFYMAMAIAILALTPFLSREELRTHFVEQLGAGKMRGPFNGWLFDRIFRQQ